MGFNKNSYFIIILYLNNKSVLTFTTSILGKNQKIFLKTVVYFMAADNAIYD